MISKYVIIKNWIISKYYNNNNNNNHNKLLILNLYL